MKKLFTFLFTLFLALGLNAQSYTINDFEAVQDTNYWWYFHSANDDTTISKLDFYNVSDPIHEGASAMQVDYVAQNSETWGGYVKLEHWNPDSTATYDWSSYDTLSFWYNNVAPQDSADRVHLRFNLHDVSDSQNGNDTYSVDDVEYYYSMHYILDNEPGWNQVKIPLVSNGSSDGNGFNLTGWSGISGNSTFDLDKIKGYSLEFSVSGSGEMDYVTGSIVFDQFELIGLAEKPLLIFNGNSVDPTFGQFTWGQSQLMLVEGGGEDPKTNSLKWTLGDEWGNGVTGAGWNIDPAVNRELRWDLDSLKFKLKAEAGVPVLKMQFESGDDGKVAQEFTPTTDGQWHEYALALSDFADAEGTTNFNPANISVFQFMTPAGATAGQVVEFDYIWTGNPVIDVVAPEAPLGVSAASDTYLNLITWLDVQGEEGEVYNVYYSEEPITDVTAAGVETVALNVGEGVQAAEHVLLAPAEDQTVNYYYAVVCVDNFANVGEPGLTPSAVTNTAKGVATINPGAPANFAADGNISEWTAAGVQAFRMYPSDGTGVVVTNTVVDNDADLSCDVYVAMDDDFLYIAYDVEDDVVSYDTTGDQWLVDSPDLYIGLYDYRGGSHTSYQRGEEPDYHFRFNYNKVILDNLGSAEVLRMEDENYFWGENFPSGYVVEAKISLDSLASIGGDSRFTPKVGTRIHIDFSLNDNDETGTNNREGIMTYSPKNEDLSYQDVSRWSHTWIGTEWVDIEEDSDLMPNVFSLGQNYPNPFNPATAIAFSVPKTTKVTLEVYNILGEKVATLLNEVKNAGTHTVKFDASLLSSGIYIYQLKTDAFISSKKMVLLK